MQNIECFVLATRYLRSFHSQGLLCRLDIVGPTWFSKGSGECDHLVWTPDQKRKTRLCHVNLLKPYCDGMAVLSDVKTVAVLNTSACVPERDTEVVVNQVIPQGRLPNLEILSNLNVHLSYLEPPNRSDVIELTHKHHVLFSDVPTRTSVLQHDIDVVMLPQSNSIFAEWILISAMFFVKRLTTCFITGLLSLVLVRGVPLAWLGISQITHLVSAMTFAKSTLWESRTVILYPA